MTLEDYIANLNRLAFWREFTFARNRFSPPSGSELELADNLVWFGRRAYILQLKQRDEPTDNPAAERSWFQKKVLKKATSQIRDSLRFLDENHHIGITNERGHRFDIQRDALTQITKVVVYLPGPALPEDCWQTRYHVSQTVGFIHIVAANDYLGILETLRVPEDIARYFAYREEVTPSLKASGIEFGEDDIMGAFLSEEQVPTPQSHEKLSYLLQDLDAFDLSSLLGNLHDHINRADKPYDYYQILQEFAQVPRSVWREVKLRFMKSLDVARDGQFILPFRLTYLETNCTFMIAPLDPDLPATGPEGEKVRVTGLQNFTSAAMYLAKSSKGIGIVISRDGEYFQIDWCLIDMPWEPDPEMERRLSENNPFRAVSEKSMDSFLFKLPPEEPDIG